MIKEACAIDSMVFPPDLRGEFKTCLGYWRKNPEVYTMIIDNASKRVIGYTNIMPLDKDTFQKLKEGMISDTDIAKIGPIRYRDRGPYYLYLCSAAVEPVYRNAAPILIISAAVKESMKRLHDSGYEIAEVAAEAISEDGEKQCKRLGLKFVAVSTSGYPIYWKRGGL